MKLDELQRLAEGATPGPWEADYAGEGSSGKFRMTECFVRRPGDNISIAADVCTPAGRPCIENAAYIAAMSPDTAKKLIAVARAAATLVDDAGPTNDPAAVLVELLRTALEELKHD